MKSDVEFGVCFELKEATAFEFTLFLIKRKKIICAKNKNNVWEARISFFVSLFPSIRISLHNLLPLIMLQI